MEPWWSLVIHVTMDSPIRIMKGNKKGFTLILPDDKPCLAGTIVSLEDNKLHGLDTLKYHGFKKEAVKKGFAFLIIATGVPVDLYFSERSLMYVDGLMKNIFSRYHLPDKDIFLLGVATSGHRALKYIEYCKSGKSLFNPAIKGVILNESPLDWVRQWYECQKQIRDPLNEERFFEGNMITYLFHLHLKATPIKDIDRYIRFSSYSWYDTGMKKSPLYKDLAIRAYTYADLRSWFSARGKSILDNNYPDMSGFINEQILAGNQRAELIVFHSTRKDSVNSLPITAWDLVDKKELVDWMVRQRTRWPSI